MNTNVVIKDRNARRRERYHNDPIYRQKIIEHERAKRERPTFDCRENLPKLATIGTVRNVGEEHEGRAELTFTIEEAARALGRTPKSLYKYFTKGLFPRPDHKVKGPTGMEQEAYTEEQMRALVNAFGVHQSQTPYYGTYHEETKNALFAAMQKATSH